MLHTIYITSEILSEETYNNIYNSLNKLSKNRGYNLYKEKDDTYKTNVFSDEGLKEIRLRKIKVDKKYNYKNKQIEIFLNPRRLIDKNKRIEITYEEDLKAIQEEFDKIINKISDKLPKFLGWTIQRVDYCVNIKTEYVRDYINLFQRADRPSKYFKELYDDKKHRRGQKEGSFYLSSNGVNINFYDKNNERLNNNILDKDSINILRLEIQCKKSKTDNIKSRRQFATKNLYYFFKEDLSRETISYYYKRTVGSGDYYKLNNAIKMIKSSDNSIDMQNKMITILREVNKKRSVFIARQESIYNRNNFNKYLKKIRELNINPVTIPERWQIDKLENLENSLYKELHV